MKKFIVFFICLALGFGVSSAYNAVAYTEENPTATVSEPIESSKQATRSWVMGPLVPFNVTNSTSDFGYYLDGGYEYIAVVTNTGSYTIRVTIQGDSKDIAPGHSESWHETNNTRTIDVYARSVGGGNSSGTIICNSR